MEYMGYSAYFTKLSTNRNDNLKSEIKENKVRKT